MDAPVRVERWPVLLAEAVEDARLRPFAWGSHDCASWAFTVAARLRGEPAPKWLGRYRTRIGARRVLRRAGVALEDIGTAVLGMPLATPLIAQRGDVVFQQGAYGICIGIDVAQPGPDGLTLSPIDGLGRAWRV